MDAYAWPAVLGLGALVRLGVLLALPEFFAWRVTPPLAVAHAACDLVTMVLVRRLAIAIVGSAPIGTLAAALLAFHPHLVLETLSHRSTAVILLGLYALIWLVVRWFGETRQLARAAVVVAALSAGSVGLWVAVDEPPRGTVASAPAAPRVERGDFTATSALEPVDPVLAYGQLVDRIFRGIAVVLALVGAVWLRARPAVVLLVIPPLLCTAAGIFGRFDLDPGRAPLLGEPSLLVLSAAGLAVLAAWWSPPRPLVRAVDTTDSWSPSSE